MSSYLEQAHGQCTLYDCLCGGTQPREPDKGGHKEETVHGDEAELYKGEGDGITKLVEDCFAGVG